MSSTLTVMLDPIALREATSQAIMGMLTPEIKANLIQNAIKQLLNPGTDSWNRDRSPIQEAFNQAVVFVAREVAKAHVEGDPQIKGRLQTLMRETADKVLNADQEKMVEKMADAFVAAIAAKERY